jgi:polysaccharide pyruvyl transferase CsaB
VRVLLSGYYGFGNLGDEALLEVIVQRLRAAFRQPAIDVLSAAPLRTAAEHGVEATARWDWRAVRAAIARADVVLSGGGGLLQNATSFRSLLYYAGVLREGVRLRRKTMIFAQSIGPLDRLGRLTVRRLCRGVQRATVRDERSRRLLSEILPQTRVERTADPVFLYDTAVDDVDLSAEGLGRESGSYAIVSVRKAPGVRDGTRLLAHVVDRLATRHRIRCAFLPLGGAADAAVATDVIRACASAPVLLPEAPLRKTAAIIAHAQVVIGMRLHAIVLAARYAVPFLAVPYDPKITALCEDLAYPLAPLQLGNAPTSSEEADALVDALVDKREALAMLLQQRLPAVRAAAARNFGVLGELLGDT